MFSKQRPASRLARLRSFLKSTIIALLFFIALPAWSQPADDAVPPPLDDSPDEVPIDDGIYLLVGAGLLYGVGQYRNNFTTNFNQKEKRKMGNRFS